MIIKLPRQCTGREIADAFKVAATFQENPKRRWEPFEVAADFQHEPQAGQTVRSMAVRVYPLVLRKKWLLFGKKVWKPEFNPEFTLTSVVLDRRYEEVEVKINYVYNIDQIGVESIASDPRDIMFQDIRPHFERIMNDFCARLQPRNSIEGVVS